jgi:predicted transcriptional regulator
MKSGPRVSAEEPRKLTVILDAELVAKLERLATSRRTSLSGWLRSAILEAVDPQPKLPGT